MFAHIYLNSPDCKYENDDDGTCLLSFLSFRYCKDNGIILHVAKMDYFFCRGDVKTGAVHEMPCQTGGGEERD